MIKQKVILIIINVFIFTTLSHSTGYISFNYKNHNINFEYEILASYSRFDKVLINDLNHYFSLFLGLIYKLKRSSKKYSFHFMKIPNYENPLKGDWKITLAINSKKIIDRQNFIKLTFPKLLNQIIEPKIKTKIRKVNKFRGLTLQLGNFKKYKNAIKLKTKWQKLLTDLAWEKDFQQFNFYINSEVFAYPLWIEKRKHRYLVQMGIFLEYQEAINFANALKLKPNQYYLKTKIFNCNRITKLLSDELF